MCTACTPSRSCHSFLSPSFHVFLSLVLHPYNFLSYPYGPFSSPTGFTPLVLPSRRSLPLFISFALSASLSVPRILFLFLVFSLPVDSRHSPGHHAAIHTYTHTHTVIVPLAINNPHAATRSFCTYIVYTYIYKSIVIVIQCVYNIYIMNCSHPYLYITQSVHDYMCMRNSCINHSSNNIGHGYLLYTVHTPNLFKCRYCRQRAKSSYIVRTRLRAVNCTDVVF